MNKSPLTMVLVGIVAFFALWSLFLSYTYGNTAKQFRELQMEVNRLAAKQQALTILFNEATEYGKTHPAIEPLLQSVRARATTAATSAPPPSPKPAAK